MCTAGLYEVELADFEGVDNVPASHSRLSRRKVGRYVVWGTGTWPGGHHPPPHSQPGLRLGHFFQNEDLA